MNKTAFLMINIEHEANCKWCVIRNAMMRDDRKALHYKIFN